MTDYPTRLESAFHQSLFRKLFLPSPSVLSISYLSCLDVDYYLGFDYHFVEGGGKELAVFRDIIFVPIFVAITKLYIYIYIANSDKLRVSSTSTAERYCRSR